MTHTDPIADMLTRIRNAILAEKKEVAIPTSNMKVEIAKILKREGFINDYKLDKNPFPAEIVIDLKYKNKKENVIEGLKRVSKPGLRVYADVESIPQVLGGLGLAILSTSKGILTGKECKQKHVGGEVLLHIW
jgi:small subunit ribosomal protein S8